MGLNLNPILRQELANLDKDADSRKSALKALKSYVKDLDSKAIPAFLAQVSETKEASSLSGEYTISLYEILARVHGPNIVPQIDTIMTTIVKTLASSAGSFPLQQACSKVVPAIARYGIDPTTPEDKKRHIIHSLCVPLLNSLLGSQESLTSGSALCLKALVDSDNWRFASDEMVNKVCQNVAIALEVNSNQTHLQMGLVMALAKHNPLIVEAYARLLIHSGLRILEFGVSEGNSQKRLSAVQMLNFLMKCLDPRSIYSEVEFIIKEMEKCQSDQMAYVRGAAYETMMTAKKIAGELEVKLEKGCRSVTGSNFSRRNGNRSKNNASNANGHSPISMSPESQTVDSFSGYDSLLDSPPHSMSHTSYNSEFDRRSVSRKLWRHENGGVDISLKDGLFSGMTQQSTTVSDSPLVPYNLSSSGGDCNDEFEGFLFENMRDRQLRSGTPSPQKQRCRINVEDIDIFSTPRRLIRSLQDPDGVNSDHSDKQNPRLRSSAARNPPCQNGFLQNLADKNVEENGDSHPKHRKQDQSNSESVSSTDEAPLVTFPQGRPRALKTMIGKNKTGYISRFVLMVSSSFVLVAILAVSLMLLNEREDIRCYPVPT
ncbi:PREDICTED: uncharacterized protein LOC104821510 [Tarenaya hassleriana]|uniref:uncharacterized protein LOC104821510 n=1 Tax=Tarenaya hassleriana TaxID=28532 RepID=UPI00053C4100|nr:PREDICTED: uncharacterized protein LOC104821510 [Tarenaya hassleriana]